MGGNMKKLTLVLVVAFVLMMCDVPALSEPTNNFDKIYREYRESLYSLQVDIACIHQELHQEKNVQAIYEHALQAVESAAVLLGKAEKASQNVQDELQFSLQSQIENILMVGLCEEEKEALKAMGYTEEDISKLVHSLALYNDYCYHAANGFTAEQREKFHSLGITDAQIVELQAPLKEYYATSRTCQKVIKEHQIGLMYIQTSLSAVALSALLERKNGNKDKGNPEKLMEAEKKLLEAIKTVSQDQSSLEHVKAYSKKVYKTVEREIRKGNEQYLFDFFVGLQVHCGAVTALHGDTEFGLGEIQLYKDVVAHYAASPERPELFSASVNSLSEKGSPLIYGMEPTEESQGRVKESREDNNVGLVIAVIKASDATDHEFSTMVYTFCKEHLIPDFIQEIIKAFLKKYLNMGIVGSLSFMMGGVIFSIIITAPPVGGSWEQIIETDPSGTFDRMYIDSKTAERIKEDSLNAGPRECDKLGYEAIWEEPIQIVYTIQCTVRLYRSPAGFYYYYALFENGDQRVVIVEDTGYGIGRVVTAFHVLCDKYECNNTQYDFIFQKWDCQGFTQVWINPLSNTVKIR